MFRKLNPPIPLFKNRVLEHYSKPKLFEEFGELVDGDCEQNKSNYYFNGWSFVNETSKWLNYLFYNSYEKSLIISYENKCKLNGYVFNYIL